MSRRAKIIIITILSIFGVGIFSAAGLTVYIYFLSKELPSVEEVSSFKYNEPTVVYDATGKVIAELGPERRYPVPMARIPKYIGQAVVAVEDSRFYEHKGVDFLGIARAFFVNLKAGRVVEGGSTLTQQLVKVIYLNPEKKLKRKIKEAIMAYRIDNYLTKEQILELYLNQVNFGRGAYGIQAAAVNYFGKNVGELTLAEGALLAGIPKGPGIYAPHINPEKSRTRRNHVLYRMYEVGFITEENYKKATEDTIVITDSVPLRLRYAGYFIDYLQKFLTETLEAENLQGMYGLKIYTTLRIDYQMEAEKAVLNNLMDISKREGFYGPISNMTQVEAIIPSKIDEGEDGEGASIGVEAKPANDLHKVPSYLAAKGISKAVVQSVSKDVVKITQDNVTGEIRLSANVWAKPNGSNLNKLLDFTTILKENDVIYVSKTPDAKGIYLLEQEPLLEGALVSIDPVSGAIYAMVGGLSYEKSFFNRAVQAQRQMGSTFKPIVYSTAFENGILPMDQMLDIPVISEEEEDGKSPWKPQNHNRIFVGEMTVKEALLKSNNTITIKVAEKTGINKIIRYAKNFGFSADMPVDMSVSLGSASSSVLEMAIAYSVFANGGYRPAEPYFVTKIEDAKGQVLFAYTPKEPVKVLEEASADIMTTTLVDTVQKGGSWRAKALRRISGGKTGTTNDSKDGWYAGFLPNMVTVTWVGYDDYRKLGDYATGSSVAATAWVAYMSSILDTIPLKLFPVSQKTAFFKVDNETKTITDAIVGNFTYEIFPVDDNGNPIRIRAGK